MNREEFMRQLDSLLQNISRTEREEALQYYNDYFDDAGAENEREVIEALGNPARVAENIKRDLALNGSGVTPGRQDGNEEQRFRDEDEQGNSVRHPVIRYANAEEVKGEAKKEPMPTWQIVLLVVGGIILAPVAVGLASGLVSAVFGLLTGWFSLIFGVGIAAVVLILSLFILLVVGVLSLPEAPFAGIAIMGSGFLCGGLGILFLMLTVALSGIATPAIFKALAKLWRWIAAKTKKEAIA